MHAVMRESFSWDRELSRVFMVQSLSCFRLGLENVQSFPGLSILIIRIVFLLKLTIRVYFILPDEVENGSE